MTFLLALADWLSDPVVLCFGCAIAWVFAVSYFPWTDKEPDTRVDRN